MAKRAVLLIASIVILASLNPTVHGLVYYTADWNINNGPPTCLETPPADSLVGLAGGSPYYPTATVIAPNFVMTATHWSGTFVGKEIKRLGTKTCNNEYILADHREISGSDLDIYRVKRILDPNISLPSGYNLITDPCNLLEDANFSTYVGVYGNSDEAGKIITMGSFGRQRVIEDIGVLGGWGYVESYKVTAGTLHWGRNINSSPYQMLNKNFDPHPDFDDPNHYIPEVDGYINYESGGANGDSGAGWFIKNGIEWQLASQYYGAGTYDNSGPRVSLYVSQIDAKIALMGGSRPAPDLADIHWQGNNMSIWADANNWDTDTLPTASKRVAIDNGTAASISSGQAYAKELFIGVANSGSLSMSSGELTVDKDLYIGGRENVSGICTVSGGELTARNIVVGSRGPGLIDIDNSNCEIGAYNLVLGKNAALEAISNSVFKIKAGSDSVVYDTIDGADYNGRFVILADANSDNLAGLANLTLEYIFDNINEYAPDIFVGIEMPGADDGDIIVDDFSTDNFLLDKLVLGLDANSIDSDAGRIVVEVADDQNNQSSNLEALFVNTLQIKAGVAFDVNYDIGNPPFNIYYKNGGSPKKFVMGDVNLDGTVDDNDLSLWFAHENDTASQWSEGDLNGDRIVDNADRWIIESAYKAATNPNPALEEVVDSGLTLQLSWTAGMYANSHDVYFSTDYDLIADANRSSPEFKGNQASIVFSPDPNDLTLFNKTYYWRVDEVDANNHIVKGRIWRFFYMERRAQNLTTGQWYGLIQNAINDANDGDTLEVAEGVHYETIVIGNKSIIIRSTDPNNRSVVENTVIDANFYGSEASVFYGDADINGALSGLTIRNANAYGVYISAYGSGNNFKITNCIIKDNGGYGIMCIGSPQISNNEIYGHSTAGIYFSTSSNPLVINNLIYDNGIGISFVYASAGVARNNTIVGCDVGISQNSGNLNIKNCIVWDNTDDFSGCSATYSCVGSTSDVGDANVTHNICANPLFADADANDFHIASNSPCINAGTSTGISSSEFDIYGDGRVMGTTVDMGADELVWHIDINADGQNTGLSWEDAFISIQDGINSAHNSDCIIIAEGVYYEPISFGGKSITVRSTDPNNRSVVENTVIDADHSNYFVVNISGSTASNAVLAGLTLKNAYAYGVYVDVSGAGSGLRVTNCIIKDNGYYGIMCVGSPLISNNEIYGNYAAGMCFPGSNGSLIANNLVYDNGTGISFYNTVSTGIVRNNTIVGCSVGISRSSGNNPDIRNCIVRGNNDDLSNCSVTYSCVGIAGDLGNPNVTHNICADPCFADANVDNFHLTSNSPCIDIGDPNLSYSGQTDIDGDDRVIDIAGKGDGNVDVDMGADEYINP